jgi:hypothetical protein
VDGIVEGSVTRSGQRMRITAQLLHGPSDKHLWADTYERDVGDVLKLQGELAEAIAEQVRAKLTPTQQAEIRRADGVDPVAHDAYLKGRLYFVNGFTKADSLRQAQSFFKQAIQKIRTSLWRMRGWQTLTCTWPLREQSERMRRIGRPSKQWA